MVFHIAARGSNGGSLQPPLPAVESSSPSSNNSNNNRDSRAGSAASSASRSAYPPRRSVFVTDSSSQQPAKSKMNHLLQVARRTGKSAVGFKIQLVIHRMNAHLSNFNGADLVAVMTRHKKKAVTKSAPYQTASKEVVWGDILPFSCTLYMAKTGLFQAKLFQIHIYDTRTDTNIATFEFDLAELVQSDKDSGKETIAVATSKCQDPRASLSLTVISSKVLLHGGRKSSGHGEHQEASEISFDGSRSELSVCTLESRTSAASSHQPHSHQSRTSPASGATRKDNAKANGIRGAFPAVNEDEIDLQDVENASSAESHHQSSKQQHQQELVRTIQDLENQLRQSESANVQLEKESTVKDIKIEQLQAENEELNEEVEKLKLQLKTSASSAGKSRADSDGVMQVDFIQYMSLKEENDKLKERIEVFEKAKSSVEIPRSPSKPSAHKEEEDSDDSDDDDDDDDEKKSEASSANEYQDAQEPHLLAEISELKHSVAVVSSERDELNRTISSLKGDNKQLLAQVKDLQVQTQELIAEVDKKDKALVLASAAASASAANDIEGTSEAEEQEEQLSEVKIENEKLVHQLNHLDHVVTKLKDEKSSLLGKLEHAESANERARQDIESAQQTIEQLHGEKENLAGKLQSAESAHERAKREIDSAELTIAQLREQVQEISAQLEATQQDLHSLRHEELAASVAATAAAVAKNQDLQERWDELRQQNSDLQARVEELEEKLAQTEADEEAKEAELQRQVFDLKQETETLREELEQLRVSKQQAEDELLERAVALKDALESQRRLTIGHEEELTQLAMSNEEMRARVEQKSEQVQELTAEWRQKFDTLEQENDYFQRELIDSKMKLAELTQQNDELSTHNKKMEKAIVEMKIQAAEKDLKKDKKK
ncbi:hypothetical protein Gpo141_00002736 [Globisporangium polare]